MSGGSLYNRKQGRGSIISKSDLIQSRSEQNNCAVENRIAPKQKVKSVAQLVYQFRHGTASPNTRRRERQMLRSQAETALATKRAHSVVSGLVVGTKDQEQGGNRAELKAVLEEGGEVVSPARGSARGAITALRRSGLHSPRFDSDVETASPVTSTSPDSDRGLLSTKLDKENEGVDVLHSKVSSPSKRPASEDVEPMAERLCASAAAFLNVQKPTAQKLPAAVVASEYSLLARAQACLSLDRGTLGKEDQVKQNESHSCAVTELGVGGDDIVSVLRERLNLVQPNNFPPSTAPDSSSSMALASCGPVEGNITAMEDATLARVRERLQLLDAQRGSTEHKVVNLSGKIDVGEESGAVGSEVMPKIDTAVQIDESGLHGELLRGDWRAALISVESEVQNDMPEESQAPPLESDLVADRAVEVAADKQQRINESQHQFLLQPVEVDVKDLKDLQLLEKDTMSGSLKNRILGVSISTVTPYPSLHTDEVSVATEEAIFNVRCHA
jgi:hypothetical protein